MVFKIRKRPLADRLWSLQWSVQALQPMEISWGTGGRTGVRHLSWAQLGTGTFPRQTPPVEWKKQCHNQHIIESSLGALAEARGTSWLPERLALCPWCLWPACWLSFAFHLLPSLKRTSPQSYLLWPSTDHPVPAAAPNCTNLSCWLLGTGSKRSQIWSGPTAFPSAWKHSTGKLDVKKNPKQTT